MSLGAKVDVWKDQSGRHTADIRLHRPSGNFRAEFEGKNYSDATLAGIKEKLEAAAKESFPLEWRRVILIKPSYAMRDGGEWSGAHFNVEFATGWYAYRPDRIIGWKMGHEPPTEGEYGSHFNAGRFNGAAIEGKGNVKLPYVHERPHSLSERIVVIPFDETTWAWLEGARETMERLGVEFQRFIRQPDLPALIQGSSILALPKRGE